MNKLSLSISASITIGIIIIAVLVALNMNQAGIEGSPTSVEISEFKLADSWENPGGLEVNLPLNITLHNLKNKDLQGLEITIEMFENGNSIKTRTFFGENENFNGTLQADQIREVHGFIGTTINATSIMFPIGGTSENFTYLAKIILNGAVLDECWAYTNITNNVNISDFVFTSAWVPGSAFPAMGRLFNITLQNLENHPFSGLLLEVKMCDANGTQLPVEVFFYGRNGTQIEPFDGSLSAGELRIIKGTITSDWHSVIDTPEPLTYIVFIKLGNETLDEWIVAT